MAKVTDRDCSNSDSEQWQRQTAVNEGDLDDDDDDDDDDDTDDNNKVIL